MKHRLSRLAWGIAFATGVAQQAFAQDPLEITGTRPFRIADNLYFVGTEGLGIFLVATPQGHILVNSGYDLNVRRLRQAVEFLGFKFPDIRILLASHAHADHVGGMALIKRMTGAKYMVMDADVPVVESGGARDFAYGSDLTMGWPATKVDRVLRDGDTVRLGGTRLVARLAPGHTKGATSWTMTVNDRGTARGVMIMSSPNVNPDYRLVDNAQYPRIAEDYRRAFRVLKALPCEIFLAAHGSQFQLRAKSQRLSAGDSSAFVDPDGCAKWIAERERLFETELARQQSPGPVKPPAGPRSGNPVLPGWYADPEAHTFAGQYWIYPTYSAPYNQQTFMDAFSSTDLVTWTKHERIIDTASVKWARRAMWAPSIVAKGNRYFLFFGANDIQSDSQPGGGGIGVAVSDKPEGPFKDLLGRPLIDKFHNGAQPIDQMVFRDTDGKHYIIYGGWRHCNIARLNDDFTGFVPFPDGSTFKEITPEGYVEGAYMLLKDGKYYFMWSEGGWTGPNYSVAYAIGDSPLGPFKRVGRILQQDSTVATGAGHHSVLHADGSPNWYIVYHRRRLGERDRNHRVVSIDEVHFDSAGFIRPVKITKEGVAADPYAVRPPGVTTIVREMSFEDPDLAARNQGRVEVVVRSTDRPTQVLPEAQVMLRVSERDTLRRMTDQKGIAEFEAPVGSHEVIVRRLGYGVARARVPVKPGCRTDVEAYISISMLGISPPPPMPGRVVVTTCR